VLPLRWGEAVAAGALGAGDIGFWWSWRRWSQLSAVVVHERKPALVAGLAADGEEPEVHHPVVHGAQGEEVVGVGAPTVSPVHEVVDV
jgi:hypothetical protein